MFDVCNNCKQGLFFSRFFWTGNVCACRRNQKSQGIGGALGLTKYLEITVEDSVTLDLSEYNLEEHVGVVLDGVGDVKTLWVNREALQGRPKATKAGKSATGMYSYPYTFASRAVIATFDLSAKNLHLFETDHWLSQRKNVIVLRLTSPAYVVPEANIQASPASRASAVSPATPTHGKSPSTPVQPINKRYRGSAMPLLPTIAPHQPVPRGASSSSACTSPLPPIARHQQSTMGTSALATSQISLEELASAVPHVLAPRPQVDEIYGITLEELESAVPHLPFTSAATSYDAFFAEAVVDSAFPAMLGPGSLPYDEVVEPPSDNEVLQ